MELFSIGHSNHEIDVFICLLKQHGITAIADVRSYPYSRFLKQFNRENLQQILAQEGIHYVFLGKELGARPNNPECYVDGKAVYEKIARTEGFYKGIQRLLKGLEKYRISLMCAEKDPITCHRAILVCQHLRCFDISINHILKNGDLQDHKSLEEKLLFKHGFKQFSEAPQVQLSLFPQNTLLSREECLKEAYKLQGDEIAYVEKETNKDDDKSSQVIYNRFHKEKRRKVL